MTALASSPDFVVRPATEDDLNYVRRTWLLEYVDEDAAEWIKHVGRDTYFAEHPKCRDAVIERGAVTIACRESVPSGICGFAVTEQDIVHFVYVKLRWRKLGVASLLLRPFEARPDVIYTHCTNTSSRLVPPTWTYNPYRFLRS